ncbi:MAG TPA: hypothetical protein VM076_19270 [Gemmatimonadaceae bacterium]|nr:hypothetical protein [Gemmatimonadaceae bacterium]
MSAAEEESPLLPAPAETIALRINAIPTMPAEVLDSFVGRITRARHPDVGADPAPMPAIARRRRQLGVARELRGEEFVVEPGNEHGAR